MRSKDVQSVILVARQNHRQMVLRNCKVRITTSMVHFSQVQRFVTRMAIRMHNVLKIEIVTIGMRCSSESLRMHF